MKNKVLIICTLIFLVNIIFFGCTKDKKSRPAPTISSLTGGKYYDGVSSVYAGQTILVGFICKWNGTDAIKGIQILADGNVVSSLMIPDSMAKGFTIDSITIIKSTSESENWVFNVIDSQGAVGSVNYSIQLNTQGNPIRVSSATISAQRNLDRKCFYSLTDSTVRDSSLTVQSKIDMLGVYDDTNGNYLASPNANNLPAPFPSWMLSWTTKNNTKFCSTNLTSQQFDYINNDYMLINSFSTNTTDQKNKAKSLKVNDVYSFKLQDGRSGLFKVTSVVAGLTGSVGIKIKIQTP